MSVSARIVALEDITAMFSPEDGIWVGSGLSIENPLVEALASLGESLRGLTLVGSNCSRQDDIFSPAHSGGLRIVSVHQLCRSKQGSCAQLCESTCRLFGINTVALRLSPPDAAGLCTVEYDDVELAEAIFDSEGIKTRIALLDISLPASSAADAGERVSIRDFDYICCYTGEASENSSIA